MSPWFFRLNIKKLYELDDAERSLSPKMHPSILYENHTIDWQNNKENFIFSLQNFPPKRVSIVKGLTNSNGEDFLSPP